MNINVNTFVILQYQSAHNTTTITKQIGGDMLYLVTNLPISLPDDIDPQIDGLLLWMEDTEDVVSSFNDICL